MGVCSPRCFSGREPLLALSTTLRVSRIWPRVDPPGLCTSPSQRPRSPAKGETRRRAWLCGGIPAPKPGQSRRICNSVQQLGPSPPPGVTAEKGAGLFPSRRPRQPPCVQGRGRRVGAARLSPAPQRKAALPSSQAAAPTCGAPAFSRRCLSPGRAGSAAQSDGGERGGGGSACDSLHNMSSLQSSPPGRAGFGAGAADGVAEIQRTLEKLYPGSSCPSNRVDLGLKRAPRSL